MTSRPDELNPEQATQLREEATQAQRDPEERFLRPSWREAAASSFGTQREAGRPEWPISCWSSGSRSRTAPDPGCRPGSGAVDGVASQDRKAGDDARP